MRRIVFRDGAEGFGSAWARSGGTIRDAGGAGNAVISDAATTAVYTDDRGAEWIDVAA